jgi:hypothetical protein
MFYEILIRLVKDKEIKNKAEMRKMITQINKRSCGLFELSPL